MVKPMPIRREPSPGKLYREIKIPKEEEKGETRLEKRTLDPFVSFCKRMYRMFPSLGKGATFESKYKEAVDFLGWELKAEEFSSAVKGIFIIAISIALIVSMLLFFTATELVIGLTGNLVTALFLMFGPFLIAAFGVTALMQNYPISAAKDEQTKALTYVPEIIGYMIMSMKLVPNLEKAVEFSAVHGKGKIANEFKRLIWDVQLGVYNTLSEGLDAIAYNWGKYSSEFKQALMMIRASVLENTEAKRYALLDKTMETVLTSIREKMETYARSLSQPSIVLFYLGVLLPLILIIILPVGSAFTGQAMARPEILILVYNIIIPLIAFFFAINLIKKRPPTYTPPKIPGNHPDLFGKYKMKLGKTKLDIRIFIAIIAIAGIFTSYAVSSFGIPAISFESGTEQEYLVQPDQTEESVLIAAGLPVNYFDEDGRLAQSLRRNTSDEEYISEIVATEKTKFYLKPQNDTAPFNLIFGLIVTASLCVFAFLYYSTIYKRKIQKEIIQMEEEFKDSLYILASRLGENKPIEEALKHTKDFLPGYKISDEIFGKTINNISVLGLTVYQAFFDPVYGSLRNIPSTIIQGSIKLMVDSVQLGVNVAARTLMSLSMQLTNSEKVTKMLSTLVSDITSMMATMSIFIAPVVLGITAALQRVVMLTLSQISVSAPEVGLSGSAVASSGGSAASSAFGLGGASLTQVTGAFAISPETLLALANPTQFLIILAIYVVELVIIMTYYVTKIEEDNDLKVRINIAKALPVAITVFLVSTALANVVVGGFFG